MTLDLDKMLARIKDRQWALADFDWDAPGADRITDEQRPALATFMADLVWIEQVGARAFASLSRQADGPGRWPRSTAGSMPRSSATPTRSSP